MSAAHTPGPWAVKNERWIVATRGEYEGEILIAPTFWLTHVPEEQAANARLIAAAPELLAALNAFLALDRTFTTICEEHLAEEASKSPMGRAVQLARAAIAKATGSTSC